MRCLETGEWSTEIVGCNEMLCAGIQVNMDSINTRVSGDMTDENQNKEEEKEKEKEEEEEEEEAD